MGRKAELIDRLLIADDIGQVIADYEAGEIARKKHPWVADIIRVLAPHKFGLRRQAVIDEVRRLRGPTVLNHPRKFEHTLQRAFNGHCGQSLTFKGKLDCDLFYSVGGKGSGVWAVHLERARAWLKERGLGEL